uniref:Uncharacterized protein n=1 Tax=Romanomermis culicivorax TaxID=13658 RepID=A0A915IXF2_ROMCU
MEAPLPLEQHFYGLPAPLRSAAHTRACRFLPTNTAANMVASLPKTANVAASITPCIVGWDSTEPQGQLSWIVRSAICNVKEVPSAMDAHKTSNSTRHLIWKKITKNRE